MSLAPLDIPTPNADPPALESYAARLYASLEPLAWADASVDYALAKFTGAIGAMFQAIEDLARDTPDGPGWSAVVDVNRCPDEWLAWLGQFVGVSNGDRNAIATHNGFNRGTVAALEGAAAQWLTGNKKVYFNERLAGDPYALGIITLEGETPDPAKVEAAILAQKPGGIVLDYSTVVGPTYRSVRTAVDSYRQARDTWPTYFDMATELP